MPNYHKQPSLVAQGTPHSMGNRRESPHFSRPLPIGEDDVDWANDLPVILSHLEGEISDQTASRILGRNIHDFWALREVWKQEVEDRAASWWRSQPFPWCELANQERELARCIALAFGDTIFDIQFFEGMTTVIRSKDTHWVCLTPHLHAPMVDPRDAWVFRVFPHKDASNAHYKTTEVVVEAQTGAVRSFELRQDVLSVALCATLCRLGVDTSTLFQTLGALLSSHERLETVRCFQERLEHEGLGRWKSPLPLLPR